MAAGGRGSGNQNTQTKGQAMTPYLVIWLILNFHMGTVGRVFVRPVQKTMTATRIYPDFYPHKPLRVGAATEIYD